MKQKRVEKKERNKSKEEIQKQEQGKKGEY